MLRKGVRFGLVVVIVVRGEGGGGGFSADKATSFVAWTSGRSHGGRRVRERRGKWGGKEEGGRKVGGFDKGGRKSDEREGVLLLCRVSTLLCYWKEKERTDLEIACWRERKGVEGKLRIQRVSTHSAAAAVGAGG
jgi:hypothetical protein